MFSSHDLNSRSFEDLDNEGRKLFNYHDAKLKRKSAIGYGDRINFAKRRLMKKPNTLVPLSTEIVNTLVPLPASSIGERFSTRTRIRRFNLPIRKEESLSMLAFVPLPPPRDIAFCSNRYIVSHIGELATAPSDLPDDIAWSALSKQILKPITLLNGEDRKQTNCRREEEHRRAEERIANTTIRHRELVLPCMTKGRRLKLNKRYFVDEDAVLDFLTFKNVNTKNNSRMIESPLITLNNEKENKAENDLDVPEEEYFDSVEWSTEIEAILTGCGQVPSGHLKKAEVQQLAKEQRAMERAKRRKVAAREKARRLKLERLRAEQEWDTEYQKQKEQEKMEKEEQRDMQLWITDSKAQERKLIQTQMMDVDAESERLRRKEAAEAEISFLQEKKIEESKVAAAVAAFEERKKRLSSLGGVCGYPITDLALTIDDEDELQNLIIEFDEHYDGSGDGLTMDQVRMALGEDTSDAQAEYLYSMFDLDENSIVTVAVFAVLMSVNSKLHSKGLFPKIHVNSDCFRELGLENESNDAKEEEGEQEDVHSDEGSESNIEGILDKQGTQDSIISLNLSSKKQSLSNVKSESQARFQYRKSLHETSFMKRLRSFVADKEENVERKEENMRMLSMNSHINMYKNVFRICDVNSTKSFNTEEIKIILKSTLGLPNFQKDHESMLDEFLSEECHLNRESSINFLEYLTLIPLFLNLHSHKSAIIGNEPISESVVHEVSANVQRRAMQYDLEMRSKNDSAKKKQEADALHLSRYLNSNSSNPELRRELNEGGLDFL